MKKTMILAALAAMLALPATASVPQQATTQDQATEVAQNGGNTGSKRRVPGKGYCKRHPSAPGCSG